MKMSRSFIPYPTKSGFPYWLKKNFAGDTHGEPLLDEFCLNIMKERAKSTSMFDGIDVYFLRNLFPVKVVLTTAGDKKVSIEFPINHINVKRETRQWQVETGPVLTPLGKNEGVRARLSASV